MRNWNSWRCNTVAFLSGTPVNAHIELWRLWTTCRATGNPPKIFCVQYSSLITHLVIYPTSHTRKALQCNLASGVNDWDSYYRHAIKIFSLFLGRDLFFYCQRERCQSIAKRRGQQLTPQIEMSHAKAVAVMSGMVIFHWQHWFNASSGEKTHQWE